MIFIIADGYEREKIKKDLPGGEENPDKVLWVK